MNHGVRVSTDLAPLRISVPLACQKPIPNTVEVDWVELSYP